MDSSTPAYVGTVGHLIQAVLSRIATVIEANRRLGPLLVDLENRLSLQVAVPLQEAVDRIPYEGLDDLGRRALRSVLGLPAALLETTRHHDPGPLGDGIGHVLGKASPGDAVEEAPRL